MPVKLDAKLPSDHAEARIEIIPLIDIMFFLLASFMLVSLSMVNLKTRESESAHGHVRRPTSPTGISWTFPWTRRDRLIWTKRPVDDNQLIGALARIPKRRIPTCGSSSAEMPKPGMAT